MKNNLCLFERPFKIQKNGVFPFEISFFHFSAVSIATLLAPVSFCQKTKKSPFATSTVGQRVLLGTEIVPILSLVPSLDWMG